MPVIGTSVRPRSGGRNGSTALQTTGRADLEGENTAFGAGTPAANAARVAHDLQTPVAIILGLCARIESLGLDPEQAADIGRIRAQAGAIGLAAGTLTSPAAQERPQSLPVDAARATREVASDLAVLGRSRGVQVFVHADTPAYVRDDHGRLRPAIMNLLTNALRQVDHGGRVRCSVKSRRGEVTIEVADDGPGVPPSERTAVLRPYAQGSGIHGHCGLGLSIVSEAAAGLGGSVSIAEADEGGAAFTLTMPQARHPGPHQRRWRAGQPG